MRTFLLCVIAICFFNSDVFSQLITQSEPGGKIVLKMHPHDIREAFSLHQPEQEIQICNLEIGKFYDVAVYQKNGHEVYLKTAKNTKEPNRIEFTATSNCESFYIIGSDPCLLENCLINISSGELKPPKYPNGSPEANISVVNAGVMHMINNVLIGGECFEVSNIVYSGHNQAKGTFSSGMTSIGMDEGIVLTTGRRSDIPGPNSATNGANYQQGGGWDPDLFDLAADDIETVTRIEFDFIPTASEISFKYAFASEEYCDYVDEGFNDVFGFFISGPGINGPFSNNAINIAVLPGGGGEVSIDNVNWTDNSAYYIDNVPIGQNQNGNGCTAAELANPAHCADDIEFDGFTTVLTASTTVTPCESYHIKLAIADVGDRRYDSAVFLEANSFDAGGLASGEGFSATTGTNVVYEPCADGVINFEQIGGDPGQDFWIHIVLDPSSTATEGLDFDALPDSVLVPAGSTTVTLPINVIADGIAEGPETIIIELLNPCDCSNNTIELIIEDPDPIEANIPPLTFCGEPGPITISPTVTGGVEGNGYNYEWSDGSNGQSITVTPTGTETYTVTVTDDCNGQDTASTTITVLTQPTASIDGSFEVCQAGNMDPVDIEVTFTGDAPWTFVYTIDGVAQPPITTSDNPYIITISDPSTIELESVSDPAGACPGTVSGTVTISEVEITPDPIVTDVTCAGGEDGTIEINVSGGTSPYIYDWSNGGSGSIQSDLPAGTYTVTVTDDNGCEGETTATVNEPPPPPPFNAFPDNQIICGLNPTTLSPSVSGGVDPYTYIWDDGSSGSSITITPAGQGTVEHWVTITDDCGDEAITNVTAEFFEIATANISGSFEICGAGNIQPIDVEVNFTGSPDWTFVYAIDGVPQPAITTDQNPYIITLTVPGNVTLLSVGDPGGNCPGTVSGNATITEIELSPSLNITNVTCNTGSDGEVEITVSGGTSPYTYDWSNGASGPIQTGLPAGTYIITVTDQNGCEGETTAVVTEPPPPPPFNAFPDVQTVCGLNSTTLTPNVTGGVSPYTYDWDDGSSGNSITVTPTGSGTIEHWVTVTDDCGAESITSVSAEFFEEPSADISGNFEICAQGNVQPVSFEIHFTGDAPWEFVYAIDGVPQAPITTFDNPYILITSQPGTYTLVSVGIPGENCPGTTTGQGVLAEITITPDASSTDETCFNEGDGTVTANGSGGSSPYTFNWSNGSTNQTQTGLPTGTYFVTVTDAAGCTELAQTSISAPPILSADATSPTSPTCDDPGGGSVSVTASGGTPGYTYNWSNGSTSPNPSGLPEGIYEVTVTDINGCETTASTTVVNNMDPPTAVALGAHLDCTNPEIVISGIGSSQGPDFTYQWTGPGIVSGGNTLTPLVDAIGAYNLVVTNTDNGCTADVDATVTGDLTPPDAFAVGGEIDCNNQIIEINGNGSSTGNNFFFEWSGPGIVSGENTLTPFVNSEGTYTLTVTNTDNGCTAQAHASVTANLDLPIATGTADELTCVVNEITIDGAGSSTGSNFSYEWLGSGIISGGNTLFPTVVDPGNYILIVTNDDTGCSSQTQVQVPLNNEIPEAEATPPLPLTCIHTTTDIFPFGTSTGPNFDYQWSGPGIVGPNNVYQITADEAGTYTLVVTNTENGCTNEVSVDVPENTDHPEAIIAPPAHLDCNFTTVTLDGSPSSSGSFFDYLWITTTGNIVSGQNSPFAIVDEPGNYILIVTDQQNGCTAQALVDVEQFIDEPDVDAGPDQLLTCITTETFLDATNTPTGGNFQFEWFGPGIIGGANTLTPEVNQLGTYEIVVTNAGNGCTSSDFVEVTLDSEYPIADAGPSLELNCGNPTVNLDGLNSSEGSEYIYEWTTANGNIVFGETTLTPIVDGTGIYELTVTNIINGCTEVAQVEITDDFDFPEIAYLNPDIIDCSNFETFVDATLSSQNGDFTYQWTTSDGNILSGENSLEIFVDQAGTYTLSIYNNENECESVEDIFVDADLEYPEPEILTPATLNCAIGEVIIDASNSSTGNNLIYEWETSDGNIISGENSLQPVVDSSGTYTLIITNLQNSCSSEETVTVEDDLSTPSASAGNPDILNCSIEEISLSGTAGGDGTLQFEWTTPTGNIVTGENSLNPTVNEPGTYLLTVTNADNDCTASSSVNIIQDVIDPIADAGAPATLNCYNPTLNLDGEDSSTGGEMTYQWSTSDGNILNGATTLTPEIDLPGTYTLIVTNTDNTCIDTAEVEIDLNNEIPIAGTGPDEIMGCGVSELELEGTANSSNPILTYEWSTPTGNVVSGGNTLNPIIDQPGIYTLTVIDPFNGCSSSESVEITQNTETPVVASGPGGEINCTTSEITLQATATGQTQNFEIVWTTADGNIVSGIDGLNPIIDAGGTYLLTVTDTTNNCFATAELTIDEDANIPLAEIQPNGGLNCVSQTVNLDATTSSQGTGITYEWTTSGGNFISGQTTLNPQIDQPGTYTLSVFDSNNNCESTETITIPMDTLSPTVALSGGILTCDVLNITIDAETNLATDDWSVTWTAQTGAIDTGDDTLTPTVSTPGVYLLTTLNNTNGCTAETSVEVTEYVEYPTVEAEDPEILTCVTTEVVIDASESSNGQIFEYQWNTNNGNIVSGENTLEPIVNEPGLYDLIITNNVNGCTSELQATVNQDVELPDAAANPIDILTCNVLELNLDGNGSETGSEFEYLWTTNDGNILADETTLSPVIDAPGTYQILVTNTLTSCTQTATVEVEQDIIDPIANAGDSPELTCDITTLELNGTLSSDEPIMVFDWSTNNGNIVSGENTLTPTVSQPGFYNLLVTNSENGCTSIAQVEVTQDVNLPVADAGEANDLTCVVFEVSLDGSGSQSGQNIDYQWNTVGGNIISGADSVAPVVNQIGTYQLTVTNLDNGCSSIANVEVTNDLINPDAEAGETAELNCVIETLELSGLNSSSGAIYSYNWSTIDGNIIAGSSTLAPVIDAPGTYEILVTNTVNGCTQTDLVNITQSTDVPITGAATPDILTCTVLEIEIDGNQSSQGTEFEYLWTTNDGNILGGETTLTPQVNQPGIYQLHILNNDNLCENTLEVEVTQDIEHPIAEAGQSDDLTCVVLEVDLNGENSSLGSEFIYEWSTTDGNIVSGETTLYPVVSQEGTYQILVTNTVNGCTTTDNVTVILDDVAPIAVIANPDILTCAVTEVNVDGTGSDTGSEFQYLWTTPDGNILSGNADLIAEVNEPGTYNLLITNNINGCTKTSQIVVNQDIVLPFAEAGEPFVLNCVDDIQYLNAGDSQSGSNIIYQWNTDDGNIANGQSTTEPGITIPGTYNLVVLNTQNGCSAADFVIITEDIPVSELAVEQPPCHEDKGTIMFTEVTGGAPPYVYSNDGGETFFDNQNFTNLDAGQYSLIVQDLNGCEDEKIINIYQPNEVFAEVETEVEVQLGDTYQINALTNLPSSDIANITWTPSESLSCDDCLNPIATPIQTTLYQIHIENENGCNATDDILIRVDKDVSVYIPNGFSPNGDGVNDKFIIYAKLEGVVEVKSFLVFSRWGETVWEYHHFQPNDPAAGWDGTHRGEIMNPAVFAYFAEIEFIDGTVKLYEGDVTLTR